MRRVRHILFFSNHLRGPKGAAGARSWHQVKCLSEDCRVTVVIPGVDPVTSQEVTEESHEGLDPVRVKVVKVAVTKNLRASVFRRAIYFLSAMLSQAWIGLTARRPDVVLSMSLPLTQLVVAALVAGVRRVPLIVDVRDMPFETAAEIGYIRNQRFIAAMKWLETKMLSRASVIITNSPYYVRYLAERGLHQERIHLAPIGYDDFGEPPAVEVSAWRDRIRAMFGESPPEFVGIYAGTLGYAFPVGEILDGAARLKGDSGVGFVFLGDGQRLPEYQELAAREAIQARFLGRVSKEDVHAACRAADFCIYPANSGKFSGAILGNKVFDYLGAGKPIIYVGGPGAVADVISELGAGLLCPNKAPEEFAAAVDRLRRSGELRQRLARGAAGFRAAGYTARVSAERLRDLVIHTVQRHKN
jgi:glycosyltransferase involved in cell wall biosynthesis